MQPFERFSQGAKAALNLAQEEALASNHHYIGTEHLLLGLLRVKDGLGGRVLRELGVEIEEVRRQLAEVVGREERIAIQQTMPTARVRQVIEIAFNEARRLDCDYVGTEHLLLGILVEGEGIAARLLDKQGVTLPRVRALLSTLATKGSGVAPRDLPLSEEVQEALNAALQLARNEGATVVSTEHLRKVLREGDAA